MLERLRASTAQMPAAQLRVLGGAVARVPADATAYAHRTSRIMVNVAAVFATPEEAPVHEAWLTEAADALRQDDIGAYVNFHADEGPEGVRAAYPRHPGAARRGQAALRPDEAVPPQPERPAGC